MQVNQYPFISLSLLFLKCVLGFSAFSCSSVEAQESLSVDMILFNGNIITIDANDTVVEALAIKDGKIVAIGANSEIEGLGGAKTQRLDLKGLTATPGLIDAHIHFAFGGMGRLYKLDLNYPKVKSIPDIVEKLSNITRPVIRNDFHDGLAVL